MNYLRSIPIFLAFLLLGIVGCGESSSQQESIKDYMSLADYFRATGATVVTQGTITQSFFSVTGQSMTVNGEQVQVYQYANEEAANADAHSISPDGSTIKNTMVSWVAPPHFYRKGQLIVLYFGSDPSLLQLLNTALGAQIAGR